MLKIGHLAPVTVIKNMPQYESYLVAVPDTGVLAMLPRKYAVKSYLVGDTSWASVFSMSGSRVIVSQKSPQYVKKILEYLMSDLVTEGKIRIKRVARVEGAPFCKVAVESPDGECTQRELFEICRPYLNEAKDYISEKVMIVAYSGDPKEYIVNALAPAPFEAVSRVILYQLEEKGVVYVESKYLALFLGKKGMNMTTAAKLTGLPLEIKGV